VKFHQQNYINIRDVFNSISREIQKMRALKN